jgi:hypothetical protein
MSHNARKPKIEKFTTIRNRLDKKMSIYIRKRDRRCVVCGSTENLNNGHYISRVYFMIRWDDRNCNTQCASCNVIHEYDPEPYRQWMKERYGEHLIQELTELAHCGLKLSRDDLYSIEKDLDKKLKNLPDF